MELKITEKMASGNIQKHRLLSTCILRKFQIYETASRASSKAVALSNEPWLKFDRVASLRPMLSNYSLENYIAVMVYGVKC
jgi:hypothetical protein